MIKNLLFDFGNIFIDLDIPATQKAFMTLGMTQKHFEQLGNCYKDYETGKISTEIFIQKHLEKLPHTNKNDIKKAWNAMLLDIPLERITFLEKLYKEKKYKIGLLSNTNEMHIQWIEQNTAYYTRLKKCFGSYFFLSHEIKQRKPNTECFDYIAQQMDINPTETLFIDDTLEHLTGSKELGFQTWQLIPQKEDITSLFTLKSDLF